MTVNQAIETLTRFKDKYGMGNADLVVETDDGDLQMNIAGIMINTYVSSNELYDYPIILISKEELP